MSGDSDLNTPRSFLEHLYETLQEAGAQRGGKR